MNCLECAADAGPVPAVAVCGRCGAGLCRDHLHEGEEVLTMMVPIARTVPVEPLARRLRCAKCEAAEKAQATGRAKAGRR